MGGTVSQLLQVLGDSIERYNSNVIGKIKNNLANDVIVYRSTQDLSKNTKSHQEKTQRNLRATRQSKSWKTSTR